MDEMLKKIAGFFSGLFGSKPKDRPAEEPDPELEPQDASDQPTPEDVVVSEDDEVDQPAPEPDEPTAPPADPLPDEEPEPVEEDRQPTPTGHQRRYCWCIDNGHGALTAGKRSPVLEDGRQLLEYEFNRDVTSRIFVQLERIGVSYFNVVPEVQVGNLLVERVRRANAFESDLPKLFVSVHANAGPADSPQHWTSDTARGIETWHFFNSTKGRKMAATFQRKLIAKTGLRNRHLKSRRTNQFYVLRKTSMPAVLTENGFYNNREEVHLLLSDPFRQQIADAHVEAILDIEANGL